jgi:hypothetical protein
MKLTSVSLPEAAKAADHVLALCGRKALMLDRAWDASKGTPVFTVEGKYTSRGWTEWTQGFQYGCALLAFDGTGEKNLLELGRRRTVERMAPHLTHTGVHDHGFNNLSTYGNLRRLMLEGRIKHNEWELAYYELAIKASGAVQAARWSDAASVPELDYPLGYVYSFNGPHSLFIDTMRTIRIMGLSHRLGHVLMGENDRKISLLQRLITHALTTRRFIVWHGTGRDAYDIKGRTAHEGIFNRNDGRFRCPSSQQGYSPFSTWTRGLAWAMLGFAEELEFLATVPEAEFKAIGFRKAAVLKDFLSAAQMTCDHYIDDCTGSDGVPYWDTGAPNLHKLADWQRRPADPMNEHEPVDSSAAAIAAQGLLRLGHYMGRSGQRYTNAGLLTAKTLFAEPYLATSPRHQGLLLHSVYHRPNGWDHIPAGAQVPRGESSLWGDYHAAELAVYIQRLARNNDYLTFFGN